MPAEFLGTGWSFPVARDPQSGEIAQARYEESVRQSVWIILGTAKGERPMLPNFGCGIHDLVFATIGAGTAAKLTTEIRRALRDWEPRIELTDVQVERGGNGETLLINITYRVRATNNSFNLVYPFYLERSAI